MLLIAILLVVLETVLRVLLSEEAGAVTRPVERLALSILGVLAALAAVVLSIVAVTERGRARLLGVLLLVASGVTGWFLAVEFLPALRGVVGQVQQTREPGMQAARRPIPQTKGANTQALMQPSLIAWADEMMVQPYQQRGHRDPAWDSPAQRLMQGTALELIESPASPGTARLRLLAAEIRRTKCDDPWVLFLVRRLAPYDPDFREKMQQAAIDLAKAGYPPFPLLLARLEALSALRREEPIAAGILAPDCLEALRGALSARPLKEADYWPWWQLLANDLGDGLIQQDGPGVCRVVEAIPGVQPWLPLCVRGRSEIDLAWQARGSGWANSVSSSQWDLFGQHLANAREVLTRSWTMDPKHPQAAKTMMTVELGTNGIEPMRRWFDSAVQEQFDYNGAYNTLRKGLLPRWFGSEEALLAFGRSCLATQRFDTWVPWQMMCAVQAVADDRGNEDAYFAQGAPWNDMQRMVDGYITHGDKPRRDYCLSLKAWLCAKRGMNAEVRQLLAQINYQLDPQVAQDWNTSVEWVPWMTTVSGPAGDLLTAAQRVKNTHPEKALEIVQQAQKTPGLPPPATNYLAFEAAEVKAMIDLRAVPWQPLTPPADLSGWKAAGGTWRVVSPTLLEVDTEDSGALLTRSQPIGDTWEVRGEFFLSARGSGRTEAALFCGPVGDLEKRGFSLRFWTRARGWNGISLARGLGEDALSKSAGLEEEVPFLVQMSNHRIRVQTRGDLWYAEQPLPEGVAIDSGALLSLGSTGGGRKTIQFRNLEWHAVGGRDAAPPTSSGN